MGEDARLTMGRVAPNAAKMNTDSTGISPKIPRAKALLGFSRAINSTIHQVVECGSLLRNLLQVFQIHGDYLSAPETFPSVSEQHVWVAGIQPPFLPVSVPW